jgi:cytochrome c biogenesis protein CcmG, thiol:disulfide interchange protein DsbE
MSAIRLRAFAVGILLTGSVVSSCSSTATESLTSSSPARNATQAPLLPVTAPGLPDFDEGKFKVLLEQLRGTPVVVNIWASWCGPCRDEAPLLSAAARSYGEQVQFLGVDILDQRQDAAAFATEFDIPYPSVFDPTGSIRDSLGFLGQPDTVFFDATGTKVKTLSGPVTRASLDAGIQQIVGGVG